MSDRNAAPPMFSPVRDIFLFVGTLVAFVGTWKLSGSAVTCATWVAAACVAVVAAAFDLHRRMRAAAGRFERGPDSA